MASVELWIAAVASVSATTGRPGSPDQTGLVIAGQAAEDLSPPAPIGRLRHRARHPRRRLWISSSARAPPDLCRPVFLGVGSRANAAARRRAREKVQLLGFLEQHGLVCCPVGVYSCAASVSETGAYLEKVPRLAEASRGNGSNRKVLKALVLY